MTLVELSLIAKRWKQPKCPEADKWIDKIWHLHTMEYYLAIKRNEALIQAATWMNLENIMLSENSQSQEITQWMILFI